MYMYMYTMVTRATEKSRVLLRNIQLVRLFQKVYNFLGKARSHLTANTVHVPVLGDIFCKTLLYFTEKFS